MKNTFFLKLSALLLVIYSFGIDKIKAQDNSGTEFWFTIFAESYLNHFPGIYIISYYDCTVTIDYIARDPLLDPSGDPNCTKYTVNVTGGVPMYVDIPYDLQAICWRHTDDLTVPETIQKNGIKVTSTAPIALYSQFFASASSEMTPILPVEEMGVEYIVNAYREITSVSNDFNARTTVVGIEDSTSITFTLPSNAWTSSTNTNGTMTHGPNSSWSIMLDKGETYTILSNDNGQALTTTPTGSSVTVDNNQGLNGMKIVANKKISVLGGTDCTWIGNDEYPGCGACDLTTTHLKPIEKWDTRYVTTQTLVRPNQMSLAVGLANPPTPNIEPYPANYNQLSVADYLLITAKDNATTVNITGEFNYTKNLNAGEWFIYESPGNSNPTTPPPTTSPGKTNHVVEANNPIQVTQMMKGWQCDNNNPADPTQMLVIEESKWRDNYIVTNPTQYANNFFVFIIKEPAASNIARNSLNLNVNGVNIPIPTGNSPTNDGTGGWSQMGTTEPYYYQRINIAAGGAIRAKSVPLVPGGTTYPFAFYASGSTNASSYGYMGGNVCKLQAYAHADTANICLGEPITFTLDSTRFGGTVASILNYNYTWTVSNGIDTTYTFSGIGSNPTHSYTPTNPPDSAGVYQGYLYIIDNAGCEAIDTFTVVITETLPPPTTGSNITVCQGDSIFLTANSSISGVTYSWTGPNAFSDTAQNPIIPNATGAMSGTYAVTISINGCMSDSVTTNVSVTPSDSITLTSAAGTDTQTVCQNSPITNITYSVTGGGTGASATGLPTGVNGNFAGGTFTISGTPTQSGVFNYTVTTNGSCTPDSATGSITVNPLPIIDSIPFTNESACGANDGSITIYASGSGLTYSIDGGATFVGSNSFTALPAGSYNIVVQSADGCLANGGVISISSAGAPAAPPASASPNPACEGDSLTLAVTNPVAGESYNWSGPNAFTATGQTVGIANITPAMSGAYTVTASVGSCVSPGTTINVTINPNDVIVLSSPAGSDNQSICLNEAITTISYSVSGGGTGATASGLPTGVTGSFAGGVFTITGTPTVVGSFNYAVITSGVCTPDTALGNITVNPAPTVVANASATSICSGDSVTLSGSGASSYSWNNSLGNGQSHTVNPTTTTTYVVTGMDANGCQNTDSITVTVTNCNQPHASFTASALSVCVGDSITFTDNSTGSSITNWNWSFGGGSPNSANTQGPHTVVFNNAGSFNITLQVTDANGIDDTTIIVTVNPAPTVVANASATSICSGDPVTLTGSGASSYSWNNGVTDGVAFNPTATATYTVVGTDANGCQNTDSITVTVTNCNQPVASFTASALSVCVGDSITFTDNSTGSSITNWNWSFSGGSPNSANTQGPHTVVFNNAGSFNITLQVTDANGIDDTTIIVTVNPLPAVAANASATVICSGDPVTLTGSGASSYSWNNGVTDGVAFNPTATATYTVVGTDANGCQNTDSVTVTVTTPNSSTQTFNECQGFSVTVGANTYNTTGTYVDIIGCDTTITNLTINPAPQITLIKADDNCGANSGSISASLMSGATPVTYNWSNGSNDSTLNNLPAGVYSVTVTDANGCSSNNNVTINDLEIDCEYFVYVPNVFSPNNDGNNDVLFVYGDGIVSLSMKIYNRWGNKVFEITDLNHGWNGKYKGKDQNTAVFVYVLDVTFINGNSITQSGNISLIK